MAPKKKGIKTGRLDSRNRDILIGDYVMTSAGTPFIVNKYGNLENPVLGSVNFKTVTDVTLITSEEYETALHEFVCNRARTETPRTAPEPETEDLDEEPIDLSDIPEAPKYEEDEDSSEEQAETVSLAEQLSDDEAILATFSDEEIILELRGRGYTGHIRKPVTSYVEVDL